MAFDAGFVCAVVNELNERLLGARIEKIFQPDKNTVILSMHASAQAGGNTVHLLIDAGTSEPRLQITAFQPDNPKVPPMFCMLLRKHLNGAKLSGITQHGFERVIELAFETRDEMGYTSVKYLIVEIMGKCSNLILLDQDKKIMSSLKLVDFSTSRLRQVLPGISYELPPSQEGNISPLNVSCEDFVSGYENSGLLPDKYIMRSFYGISPLVARELAFTGGQNSSALYESFSDFVKRIKEKNFTPFMIKKPDGTPFEYCFMPIQQYGDSASAADYSTFGELCDEYFGERSRIERTKQRAADLFKILTNAETRLTKKISAQENDLKECAKKEELKRNGDLITSNIYRLKRGMETAELIDYNDPDMKSVKLDLDGRLTPAQNAQRYYKKYNKAKSAEIALKKQIELARNELEYVYTVFEALTKAENETDLAEIRRELYESGYASKMKNVSLQKQSAPKPLEFRTDGGYRVLCGKNNSQNDYITHKLASKGDIWFHVKGMPGSHVVLFCDGAEPPELDFSQAAIIAAYYSKADRGQKVAVDYTRVKNLKKPPASKPGYVTFSQNYSAYVTPESETVRRLEVKNRK